MPQLVNVTISKLNIKLSHRSLSRKVWINTLGTKDWSLLCFLALAFRNFISFMIEDWLLHIAITRRYCYHVKTKMVRYGIISCYSKKIQQYKENIRMLYNFPNNKPTFFARKIHGNMVVWFNHTFWKTIASAFKSSSYVT